LGWWHWGHSTVVTGESFQLAARRLRVLDLGVFHLGFAMIAFRWGARARTARILGLSAARTEPAALFFAHDPERQCGRYELPDEVAHVEHRVVQDIVLAERIARSAGRIEAFVDVDVERDDYVVQAPVAFSGDNRVDRPVDLDPAIHSAQIERKSRGLRECVRGERRDGDRFVKGDRAP
jgi:hypothetical protein